MSIHAEPLKIVHVGLGPVGLSIARLVAERRAIEIMGAVDTSPHLAGRDLGEMLGTGPSGVTVSLESEAAALLESARPEVVIHATGSFLEDVAEPLRAILARGVSVVSTCEELSY